MITALACSAMAGSLSADPPLRGLGIPAAPAGARRAIRPASVAEPAAGVGHLPTDGDELPVVVRRMEGQPQDAVGAGEPELAVGDRRVEGTQPRAAGAGDDLADPRRAGLLAGRIHRREPFVVMVVTVDDQVRSGVGEHLPERRDLRVVAVLARAEP